ncbi:uncharacterized protein Dwil_GK10587 [Drosophila willistoni]|uniref:Uncharacterized protein n=2 Tax=Drosophila willistoni TaxID=7260 RepID=A0A0Q9X639_DROWI|nr:uncharacterized protein Dwil_GK10587 [Drosophila willistoni]
MQLGAVTADGNFVTMGGVVVGRIQHSRDELEQEHIIIDHHQQTETDQLIEYDGGVIEEQQQHEVVQEVYLH